MRTIEFCLLLGFTILWCVTSLQGSRCYSHSPPSISLFTFSFQHVLFSSLFLSYISR
ncbi:hypothetical protein GLYMA_01G147550v4 [Glycine max]|nr:hypothetical protein GLYMA_01G147550v4 [Glycine max]KAH1163130.1 hypothetical protein GYH30_001602 [Glycine max]